MAERPRTAGNIFFWQVWYGKLCQLSKDPKEGFVFTEVKNAKGEVKSAYIKQADLFGWLEELKFQSREIEFTKGNPQTVHELIVKIKDEDGRIDQIQFTFANEGIAFLKKVPFMDFKKQYEISTGGKPGERTSVFVKDIEADESLKDYYKKDDPKDMPPAVVTQKLGGQGNDYDFRAQNAWFYNKLMNEWGPAVAKAAKERNEARESVPQSQESSQAANPVNASQVQTQGPSLPNESGNPYGGNPGAANAGNGATPITVVEGDDLPF